MLLTLGMGRIEYPDNFKVSGFRFLSDGSIILLSLSGFGVLGYPPDIRMSDIFLKIVISGEYLDPDLDP